MLQPCKKKTPLYLHHTVLPSLSLMYTSLCDTDVLSGAEIW